jgi:AcrR family transcriptional regulator
MRLRQHIPQADSRDTRDAIKHTARRLFAERGIDGVSVKEIVVAAGQRNGGSLHYHFRTKEALVRELVVDGAKLIDQRRNAQLDELEQRETPPTMREIIEILVLPSTDLALEAGVEDTYLRFITILQLSHRQLFLDALENQWNSGYLRCLTHIRNLLQSVPNVILNQRLVFMGIYLPAVMAVREGAVAGSEGRHDFWSSPHLIENFIDSLEALLRGPVSAQTQRQLAKGTPRTPAKCIAKPEHPQKAVRSSERRRP